VESTELRHQYLS